MTRTAPAAPANRAAEVIGDPKEARTKSFLHRGLKPLVIESGELIDDGVRDVG